MQDHELRRRLDKLQEQTDHNAFMLRLLGRAVGRIFKIEQEFDMATQETLDRLTVNVQANTDAAAAAALALTGFVTTVADLTAALQAAIEADDEVAIKAAADAIEANNTTLVAAIPKVAEAVKAGT